MAKTKATKSTVKKADAKEPAAPAVAAKSEGTTVRRYKASAAKRLGLTLKLDLPFGAMVAEFVGAFVLTFVVLATGNSALLIALTIWVLNMLLSRLSGGHINPIFTLVAFVSKQITWSRGLAYLLAQALGAMLALIAVSTFIAQGTPIVGSMGMPIHVFKAELPEGTWEPFLAEALGAAIIGFGAAAVRFGKKTGLEAGFMLGGAVLLGYFMATLGSAAILNPAAALSLSAFNDGNMWALFAYLVGPLVGGVAGAFLYQLLQWDVTNTATSPDIEKD